MNRATYSWRQLGSGPRLAVATLPDSECAALSIHIPAGSRDEEEPLAGLAHFLEHMVFKGTARRSARDLSLEVESAGGQINACTSEDQTVYEGRGEADLLPLLADLLSDMVWRAELPESEIELEREVIGEEITLYRESPADHIGDLISQALWSPHPLGHSISGSLESIGRIDRRALRRFRDLHHQRRDIVISAAGPYGIDEVEALLAPHLPGRFRKPPRRIAFDPGRACRQHVEDRRETDQLQLALAWHAVGRHSPQRHALRLLSLMLGESASSRLFQSLREERGLCYQIASDVTLFDDTGAFEISAGLDPDGRDEALELIEREIRDLCLHGPREGELERAKRLAIAQSKQAFESTAAHAAWAGEGLLDFGEIPEPARWREQVLAVSPDEIREAAIAHFDGVEPCVAEIRPE